MIAKSSSVIEITNAIKKNYIAILPIGSCEQHGPHLPLGTDSYLAEYYSLEISKKINSVIFPTLEFGYSWVWTGLSGTMTVSQNAFKNMLFELGESLIKMGFKKILFVNGHDSNKMAIKYVVRDLFDKHNFDILNVFYPNMSKIYNEHMESPTWGGMFHADEFETSLMLSLDETLVDMEKSVSEYPEVPPLYGLDSSTLANVSKTGVFGDATKATKEKGDKMIKDFVDYIVEKIK